LTSFLKAFWKVLKEQAGHVSRNRINGEGVEEKILEKPYPISPET
jgi:hypothetical protein